MADHFWNRVERFAKLPQNIAFVSAVSLDPHVHETPCAPAKKKKKIECTPLVAVEELQQEKGFRLCVMPLLGLEQNQTKITLTKANSPVWSTRYS